MVLPLLFVPLVYAMSSTPDACAEPRDPNWGKSGNCFEHENVSQMTCCWEEPDILNPGETITWCQTCQGSECSDVFRSSSTGPPVLPDEGVVDEPTTPAPSPTSPFRPPTGGVFDPPTQTPPPPQNDGSGPLNPQGGGILQQPEEVEDPEDERESVEKEGDQGQDTAGPLT